MDPGPGEAFRPRMTLLTVPLNTALLYFVPSSEQLSYITSRHDFLHGTGNPSRCSSRVVADSTISRGFCLYPVCSLIRNVNREIKWMRHFMLSNKHMVLSPRLGTCSDSVQVGPLGTCTCFLFPSLFLAWRAVFHLCQS